MSSESQFIPITLPSKGLAYENIDVTKIAIRPFKGKEEALIAELSATNLKKNFATILRNVLQGIEPEQLTSGDALYVMLWEALNSYDNSYPIKIVCEECLQKIKVVGDISKIDSKELPLDYAQPIEVKLSESVVKLRLSTLQDEMNAIDWETSTGSSYAYSYAVTMVDDSLTLVDKVALVEEMLPKDLNEIRKFHEKYAHGPDMIVPYICPKCGYEGKLELPFQFEPLFSFGE